MAIEPGSSKSTLVSSSSFDSYYSDVQNSILRATKLAVALPTDVSFHQTVDDSFAREIDCCSSRTLRLTNSLLELSRNNYSLNSPAKRKRKLEVQEDVVDSFGSLVVDVLDQLFERVVCELSIQLALC